MKETLRDFCLLAKLCTDSVIVRELNQLDSSSCTGHTTDHVINQS